MSILFKVNDYYENNGKSVLILTSLTNIPRGAIRTVENTVANSKRDLQNCCSDWSSSLGKCHSSQQHTMTQTEDDNDVQTMEPIGYLVPPLQISHHPVPVPAGTEAYSRRWSMIYNGPPSLPTRQLSSSSSSLTVVTVAAVAVVVTKRTGGWFMRGHAARADGTVRYNDNSYDCKWVPHDNYQPVARSYQINYSE